MGIVKTKISILPKNANLFERDSSPASLHTSQVKVIAMLIPRIFIKVGIYSCITVLVEIFSIKLKIGKNRANEIKEIKIQAPILMKSEYSVFIPLNITHKTSAQRTTPHILMSLIIFQTPLIKEKKRIQAQKLLKP